MVNLVTRKRDERRERKEKEEKEREREREREQGESKHGFLFPDKGFLVQTQAPLHRVSRNPESRALFGGNAHHGLDLVAQEVFCMHPLRLADRAWSCLCLNRSLLAPWKCGGWEST